MAVDVYHIGVMNTTDGKISSILTRDALQKNEDKFHDISTDTMKDGKVIVVEAGSPGSGECYTLMAKIPCFCS